MLCHKYGSSWLKAIAVLPHTTVAVSVTWGSKDLDKVSLFSYPATSQRETDRATKMLADLELGLGISFGPSFREYLLKPKPKHLTLLGHPGIDREGSLKLNRGEPLI